MGSFLKFGQAVPDIFEFCAPKKVFSDKSEKELTYLGPKNWLWAT